MCDDRTPANALIVTRMPPSKRMSPILHNSIAFTLLELLVMIAIISILTALLFPFIMSAQANANAAKCAGNLRQLGVANQLYAGDHNGEIVSLYTNPADSATMWPWLLAPYLGIANLPPDAHTKLTSASKAFICPAAPTRFGYGHNYYYLGWATGSALTSFTVRFVQVARPAETVFLVDCANVTKSPPIWSPDVRPPILSSSGLNDHQADFRHPGSRANVLWVDGHVTAELKVPLMIFNSNNPTKNNLWDLQ